MPYLPDDDVESSKKQRDPQKGILEQMRYNLSEQSGKYCPAIQQQPKTLFDPERAELESIDRQDFVEAS